MDIKSYFSNVAKSANYIVDDILKVKSPATYNLKNAVKSIKEARSEVQAANQQEAEERALREANKTPRPQADFGSIASNFAEDLKSGNFYNKKRIRKMNDEFDRANMGGSAFSMDFGDILGGVSNSTTEVGNKISEQTKVSISLARTQMMNDRRNITITDRQHRARHIQLLELNSTVSDNLGNMVEFNNDKIAPFMDQSLQYYRDSIFEQRKLNASIDEIQELYRSSFSEQDSSKVLEMSAMEKILGSGSFDFGAYYKLVAGNLKKKFQPKENEFYIPDGTDKLVASPISQLVTSLFDFFAPRAVTEQLKSLEQTVSGIPSAFINSFMDLDKSQFFDNIITKLSNTFIGNMFGINPMTKDLAKGGITQWIREVFGLRENMKYDISNYHKGPMQYNGVANRAITNVIPGLLGKIYTAVLGINDEVVVDYEKGGRLEWASDKRKDIETRRENAAVSAMADFNTEMTAMIRALNVSDEKKEEIMKNLGNINMWIARGNKLDYKKEDFATTLQNGIEGMSAEQANFFTNLFREMPISVMNKVPFMQHMAQLNIKHLMRALEARGEQNGLVMSEMFGGLFGYGDDSATKSILTPDYVGIKGQNPFKDAARQLEKDRNNMRVGHEERVRSARYKMDETPISILKTIRQFLAEGIIVYPIKEIPPHVKARARHFSEGVSAIGSIIDANREDAELRARVTSQGLINQADHPNSDNLSDPEIGQIVASRVQVNKAIDSNPESAVEEGRTSSDKATFLSRLLNAPYNAAAYMISGFNKIVNRVIYGDENGNRTPIAEWFQNKKEQVKNWAKEKWEDAKQKFFESEIGQGLTETKNNVINWFTKSDEEGENFASFWADIWGKTKRKATDIYYTVKDYGEYFLENFKNGTSSVHRFLFGDEEKNGGLIHKDIQNMWGKIGFDTKKIGSVVGGASVGYLASLFLPGGPLLWGMIGAGDRFIAASDKLKEALFGTPDNPSKYLPQDVVDALPEITKGTGLGIVGGMLLNSFLPGGPVTATIVGGITGAVAGYLKKQNILEKLLIGNKEKGTKGVLTKVGDLLYDHIGAPLKGWFMKQGALWSRTLTKHLFIPIKYSLKPIAMMFTKVAKGMANRVMNMLNKATGGFSGWLFKQLGKIGSGIFGLFRKILFGFPTLASAKARAGVHAVGSVFDVAGRMASLYSMTKEQRREHYAREKDEKNVVDERYKEQKQNVTGFLKQHKQNRKEGKHFSDIQREREESIKNGIDPDTGKPINPEKMQALRDRLHKRAGIEEGDELYSDQPLNANEYHKLKEDIRKRTGIGKVKDSNVSKDTTALLRNEDQNTALILDDYRQGTQSTIEVLDDNAADSIKMMGESTDRITEAIRAIYDQLRNPNGENNTPFPPATTEQDQRNRNLLELPEYVSNTEPDSNIIEAEYREIEDGEVTDSRPNYGLDNIDTEEDEFKNTKLYNLYSGIRKKLRNLKNNILNGQVITDEHGNVISTLNQDSEPSFSDSITRRSFSLNDLNTEGFSDDEYDDFSDYGNYGEKDSFDFEPESGTKKRKGLLGRINDLLNSKVQTDEYGRVVGFLDANNAKEEKPEREGFISRVKNIIAHRNDDLDAPMGDQYLDENGNVIGVDVTKKPKQSIFERLTDAYQNRLEETGGGLSSRYFDEEGKPITGFNSLSDFMSSNLIIGKGGINGLLRDDGSIMDRDELREASKRSGKALVDSSVSHFKAALSTADEMRQITSESIKSGLETGGQILAVASDEISYRAKQGLEIASNAVSAAASSLRTGLSKASEIATGVIGTLKEGISKAAGFAMTAAKTLGQGALMAGKIVAGAAAGLVALPVIAGKKIVDLIGPAIQKLPETIGKGIETVENAATSAYETLAPIVKNTFENIGEKLSNIKENFSEILSNFSERAKDLFGKVRETFSNIFGNIFNKENIENAKGRIGETVENVKSVSVDLYGNIKDKVSNTYENTKERIADTVDTVQNKAVDIYGNVKDTFVDLYGNVVNRVPEVYENTKERIADTVDTVQNKAVDIYGNVKDKISNTYENIKDTVPEVYENTKERASEAYQNAKQKVSNAVDTTKNIASGISEGVKGIFNGEAFSEPVEAVESIISSVNGEKSSIHFDISSPSKFDLDLKRAKKVVVNIEKISGGAGRQLLDAISGSNEQPTAISPTATMDSFSNILSNTASEVADEIDIDNNSKNINKSISIEGYDDNIVGSSDFQDKFAGEDARQQIEQAAQNDDNETLRAIEANTSMTARIFSNFTNGDSKDGKKNTLWDTIKGMFSGIGNIVKWLPALGFGALAINKLLPYITGEKGLGDVPEDLVDTYSNSGAWHYTRKIGRFGMGILRGAKNVVNGVTRAGANVIKLARDGGQFIGGKINNALGRGAANVADDVAEGVAKNADDIAGGIFKNGANVVDDVAEGVAKNAPKVKTSVIDDLAKGAKHGGKNLSQLVSSYVDNGVAAAASTMSNAVAGNSTVQKLMTSLDDGIKKLMQNKQIGKYVAKLYSYVKRIFPDIAKHLAKAGATTTAKMAARTVSKATFYAEIAFMINDAVTGFTDYKNILGIPSETGFDFIMASICAVSRFISGFCCGIIPEKLIAELILKIIGRGNELEKLQAEFEQNMEDAGFGDNVEQYSKFENPTFWQKMGSAFGLCDSRKEIVENEINALKERMAELDPDSEEYRLLEERVTLLTSTFNETTNTWYESVGNFMDKILINPFRTVIDAMTGFELKWGDKIDKKTSDTTLQEQIAEARSKGTLTDAQAQDLLDKIENGYQFTNGETNAIYLASQGQEYAPYQIEKTQEDIDKEFAEAPWWQKGLKVTGDVLSSVLSPLTSPIMNLFSWAKKDKGGAEEEVKPKPVSEVVKINEPTPPQQLTSENGNIPNAGGAASLDDDMPASALIEKIFQPVAEGTYKYISSPYGNRDWDGDGTVDEFHDGLDYAAVAGTPIYAAKSGIAYKVAKDGGNNGGWGNHVRIRHNDGHETIYAHASKVLVNQGDAVPAGTKIAEVGTTGRSTGNHLHFSVYKTPSDGSIPKYGTGIEPTAWLNNAVSATEADQAQNSNATFDAAATDAGVDASDSGEDNRNILEKIMTEFSNFFSSIFSGKEYVPLAQLNKQGGDGSNGDGGDSGSNSPSSKPANATVPSDKDFLGVASVKYETGAQYGDPAMVSSGAGDPYGGISYGIPQFSTVQGSAKTFVDNIMSKYPVYNQYFKGKEPGTSAFGTAWKQAAADRGDEFRALQLNYIYDNFYNKWRDGIKANHGIDIDTDRGLQEMGYSVAVQHGPGSAGQSARYDKAVGVTAGMTPTQVVDKVFQNRNNLSAVRCQPRWDNELAELKKDYLGKPPIDYSDEGYLNKQLLPDAKGGPDSAKPLTAEEYKRRNKDKVIKPKAQSLKKVKPKDMDEIIKAREKDKHKDPIEDFGMGGPKVELKPKKDSTLESYIKETKNRVGKLKRDDKFKNKKSEIELVKKEKEKNKSLLDELKKKNEINLKLTEANRKGAIKNAGGPSVPPKVDVKPVNIEGAIKDAGGALADSMSETLHNIEGSVNRYYSDMTNNINATTAADTIAKQKDGGSGIDFAELMKAVKEIVVNTATTSKNISGLGTVITQGIDGLAETVSASQESIQAATSINAVQTSAITNPSSPINVFNGSIDASRQQVSNSMRERVKRITKGN